MPDVRTLMKSLICLLAILALAPACAWSCSPWQEDPFELESLAPSEELVPAVAPTARVVKVIRGRKTQRGGDTCGELASISIAVRDESPGRPYVFAFEQVAGTAPDQIFFHGLYTGQPNGAGEQIFNFAWPDLEESPRPFELTVKITPHSRNGTPGPSAELVIRDGF